MEGWLKLHRKTLQNPVVFKDGDHLSIWIYLLLNAKFDDCPAEFMGEKITLKPGQLITGRKSISEKLRVTESKVQRVLKCFENEHQIEQRASNKNRLITILSWDIYQGSEQQNEEDLNNKRTTDEQQMNTKKELKNLRNKDLKHMPYSGEFEEFWNQYPRQVAKKRAYACWLQRIQEEEPDTLIQAATNYAKKCEREKVEEQYIKHPSTFLSAKGDYADYVSDPKVVEIEGYERQRQARLAETQKFLEEAKKREEECKNNSYDPKPVLAELRRKWSGTGSS